MTSAQLKAALVKQQEISNSLPANTLQSLADALAAAIARIEALEQA